MKDILRLKVTRNTCNKTSLSQTFCSVMKFICTWIKHWFTGYIFNNFMVWKNLKKNKWSLILTRANIISAAEFEDPSGVGTSSGAFCWIMSVLINVLIIILIKTTCSCTCVASKKMYYCYNTSLTMYICILMCSSWVSLSEIAWGKIYKILSPYIHLTKPWFFIK